MGTEDKKRRVIKLIDELLHENVDDKRSNQIMSELKSIVPDPKISDHIFHSKEFYNEDDSFDYEGLLKKCFDDYEPNVIAL